MNYHTDQNHPIPRDTTNGTAVYWNDQPDHLSVLVWNGYSSGDGEYNATLARFEVNKENKTLTLKRVTIKRKYSPWDEFLTNPRRYMSDRMKRVAREFVGKESGSQYWRVI